MTAHAKWEYLKTIYARYRQARRPEKQQILDDRRGVKIGIAKVDSIA